MALPYLFYEGLRRWKRVREERRQKNHRNRHMQMLRMRNGRRLSSASNLSIQSFGKMSGSSKKSNDVCIEMEERSLLPPSPAHTSTPIRPKLRLRALSCGDQPREGQVQEPHQQQPDRALIANMIERLDDMVERELHLSNRLAMVTIETENARLREIQTRAQMNDLERRLRDRRRMQALDEELGMIDAMSPLDLTREEERESETAQEEREGERVRVVRRSQRARNQRYENLNEEFMANQNK